MTENLFTALAKANTTLKNPGKDGRGNYGTYLTLDALLDHVRPVLADEGLSVTQDVIMEGDRVQIVTQLHHASGESIVFGPLSGPTGQNWQQLGGAITYGRRYALLAALGMAGGDDDDAQAHTDANPVTRPTSTPVGALRGPAAKAMTGPASDKQIGMVRGLMRDQHITDVVLNEFCTDRLGFEFPPEGAGALTKGQASAIIEALTSVKGGLDKPVTRTTGPLADDPWAAPLIDPATGEVAQ
jgi:hypothetical protein